MKREFLEDLKLEKDVIDKIMDENGKDIERYKTESENLKTTNAQQKTQLDEANKQIESFRGMDIEGIKKAADDYKAKYEESEKNHKSELDKLVYNSAAEKFIDSLKPADDLSKKAILAEFNSKQFKLDGEMFQGGKEWAEQFKKDNASHFLAGDGKVTTVSSGDSHGDSLNGDIDKFIASAMKGAGIAQENK